MGESARVIVAPQAKDAAQILAAHAKSFSFAGFFLPRTALRRAAMVYAFCRWVDDVADESLDTGAALGELEKVSEELMGRRPPRVFVQHFRQTASRMDLDLRTPELLIQGVISDLDQVDLKSERELDRYCYLVASTVGLMMCSVLEVKNSSAFPFAIDLGIAMQLTNISRDVKEDRDRGRNYLPPGMGIGRCLLRADLFYESAFRGLYFIPWRARFAICVAAVIYRAIGDQIRKQNCDPERGRARVSFGRKIFLVMTRALPLFLSTLTLKPVPHEDGLHEHLRGFPGVN